MLVRWSNDKLKATLHKVVSPTTTTTTTTTTYDGVEDNDNTDSTDKEDEEEVTVIIPERYSIAFFCNANKDADIECLETCCNDTDNPRKYPSINSYEYLTQRLAATIQTSPY
jgi:isopenicillin N synthase-like dioxygenase